MSNVYTETVKEYAKYPLSLTLLGTIIIIVAGIIYGSTFSLIQNLIILLLEIYVALTLINSFWFKVGRFAKVESQSSASLSTTKSTARINPNIKIGLLSIVLAVFGMGLTISATSLTTSNPLIQNVFTVVGFALLCLGIWVSYKTRKVLFG